MRAALVLVAALLAAPLAAADRDPLSGRTAGKSSECVSLSRVQGPDIQTDGTIIYRQNRRRIWVTRPVDSCPSLRPPATLIAVVYGAQLCRNDRFRVLETNSIIPGPICRFDRFVPYDLPASTGRSD